MSAQYSGAVKKEKKKSLKKEKEINAANIIISYDIV